jgi:hypothetical protein
MLGSQGLGMKSLTIYEAEAEARWRWGGLLKRGFARQSGAQRRFFEVGTKRLGSIKILGKGTSWEIAFCNADRQASEKGGAS